jgi:DNA-directed RNA polymerase III subunit RPC5
MNYDKCKYIGARVKPRSKKLELEVSLDTKNSNYSQSKGEQFASNVDGKFSLAQQSKYYKSNLMDKQVFQSLNAAPSNIQNHYYVGLLDKNEFHLTPLRGVYQMRPSFEYFDISEKKFKDAKEAASAMQEAEYLTEEEGDENEADKTELITIKYAKDAHAKKEATQENENWIQLAYSRSTDPGSIEIREKLLCTNKENLLNINDLVPNYFDKLLGVEEHKHVQDVKSEPMQL